MQKRGYAWKDSPIAGGGGEQARTVLRARVAAGTPRTPCRCWGSPSATTPTRACSATSPASPQGGLGQGGSGPAGQVLEERQGQWVAAPVNIHRTNWIWANKKIFDELKISPPKTFDELLAVSAKIKAADTSRSRTAASLAGSHHLRQRGDVGRRAGLLQEGDDRARLGRAGQQEHGEGLRSDGQAPDPGGRQLLRRDWNLATAWSSRQGAMQMMGDWAKGEFIKAGKKPNVDFLCFQYPGTEGNFIFNTDQFAMFKVGENRPRGSSRWRARHEPELPGGLQPGQGLDPGAHRRARHQVRSCGKKSMADLKVAIKNDTMVGSFAHGHAMPDAVKGAAYDVVTKFFNHPGASSADAVKELVKAVEAAK